MLIIKLIKTSTEKHFYISNKAWKIIKLIFARQWSKIFSLLLLKLFQMPRLNVNNNKNYSLQRTTNNLHLSKNLIKKKFN